METARVALSLERIHWKENERLSNGDALWGPLQVEGRRKGVECRGQYFYVFLLPLSVYVLIGLARVINTLVWRSRQSGSCHACYPLLGGCDGPTCLRSGGSDVTLGHFGAWGTTHCRVNRRGHCCTRSLSDGSACAFAEFFKHSMLLQTFIEAVSIVFDEY